MLNAIKKSLVTLTFFCITLGFMGEALAVTLPAPAPTNARQYGDFYSYSLPILAYYYDQDFGGGVGPGNPFYVNSTPGQIKDDIVVATGASGNPVNTNFAGMDDAYPTPNSSGIPIFSTGDTADPGGAGEFTGDIAPTWDAQLSAMNTYLGSSDLIFFFNNNQVNSGAASNQNLFAWAQVRLIDTAGVLPTKYFDLTNTNTGFDVTAYNSPGAPTSNYPFAGGSGTWPQSSDFVLSGGQVWLDPNTGLPFIGSNPPANFTVGPFNHNLGANQAAYAIFSPELNTLIKNYGANGYDVLQGDLRMTALNNGYEQLFIQRGSILPPENPIPEPTSMILLGMGLAGLAAKRFKKAA